MDSINHLNIETTFNSMELVGSSFCSIRFFIFLTWQNFLHLFSIDRGRKRHDISDKLLAISTIHWLSDPELWDPSRALSLCAQAGWLRDSVASPITRWHRIITSSDKCSVSMRVNKPVTLSSINMRIFLIVITFIFCKIARFENLASNNGRCKLKHFLSESLQLRTRVLKITGN